MSEIYIILWTKLYRSPERSLILVSLLIKECRLSWPKPLFKTFDWAVKSLSSRFIFSSQTCHPLLQQTSSVAWSEWKFMSEIIMVPAQTLLSSRLLSKNLKIKIYETIILPVVLYVYYFVL